MSTTSIVAVSDASITCGAVTFWRLQGEVDLAKLRVGFAAAGLPEEWLPSPPSSKVALTRALAAIKTSGKSIVHLKNGGHAVVALRENESETDLAKRVTASATLTVKLGCNAAEETCLIVDFPENDEQAERDATDVHGLWQHYCQSVVHGDASPWLSQLMTKLDALCLRDGGGVYFVPATHVQTWSKIVTALASASAYRVSTIPAMKSDEAVASILAALEDEAASHVAAIDALLEADEVGARAIRNRIKETDDVAAKLARYEALLGEKLTAMTEKLETTRASLSLAEMAAMNADESARGAA